MISFLIKRIVFSIFVFALVAFISFGLVCLYPGDFYTGMGAWVAMSGGVSREEAQAMEEVLRAESGLNKPFIEQFGIWFGGVVTDFDLGLSLKTKGPVSDYILRRGGELWLTLVVTGSSLLLAIFLGIPAGAISALRRGRFPDIALTLITYPLATLPGYYVGLLVQWFIYKVVDPLMVGAGLFGLCGWQFIGKPMSWGKFGSCIVHMLPIWFVVGGPAFATVSRIVRMSLLDILSEHYILTARGKGLSTFRVIGKHAMRNAINPLISTVGTLLPLLLLNSLLVAKIFGVPAFGRLFVEAIRTQDQHVVTAGLLIYATLLIIGNLLADILLVASDPRIRYE